MDIRGSLNEHRTVTGIVTAIVLLLALSFAYCRLKGDAPFGSQGQAFYTVDNGSTWFADDIGKIPPFDHGGRPAYRCYVYTTDGGKTMFVLYLERYTDEAKTILERLHSSGTNADVATAQVLMAGVEVKRAGAPDTAWVKKVDPRTAAIMAPGSAAKPDQIAVSVQP